jgi:V/A-type H+-transporting ATPase subunit C
MQTSYIYSVSRANTLAQYLLSKTDVERLLVAEAGEELESALKETYLAPYVLRSKDGNVAEAIEWTLIDAKKLIHTIAPKGDMFRVLWARYDIHNLRVFAKAKAKQLSFEQVEATTYRRGIYEPHYLYNYAESGELNILQEGWQAGFDEAVSHAQAGELDKIDGVLDKLFFTTIKRIAGEHKDKFISSYVAAVIDIYNLRSRLRCLRNPDVKFEASFIEGGTIEEDQIETEDAVTAAFAKLMPAEFWRTALESFSTSGNTTQLDARGKEYLMSLAKKASTDAFSSASLVAYYAQCEQAAANIRTIVVGKNSGMKMEEIRANLSVTYVYD